MSKQSSNLHRIIRGDSMVKLRKVRTESVSLICTDPPYGIGYTSTTGVRVANDERPYIWWLAEAFRVAAPDSSLICFTRWDVQEFFRLAIECAGFTVRSQLVWDKLAYGMGDCKGQFSPSHEVMWFATKGRFAFPGPRPESVVRDMRPQSGHRFHPTEKPVGLLRSLVVSCTREGDVVLDPFAGSGSCGVACVRSNRRFIGIELDGRYANRARRRIAEERGRGTLFG